jgi:hypothetical protein
MSKYFHKDVPVGPNLRLFDPVHLLTPDVSKVHYNILSPTSVPLKQSLIFKLCDEISVWFYHLPHIPNTLSTYIRWFNYFNNT